MEKEINKTKELSAKKELNIKKEIIEKISTLVTTAFGLVAALAWNGAIQRIFKEVFGEAEGVFPMLIYAIVITVIAVIATVWISRLAEKIKNI